AVDHWDLLISRSQDGLSWSMPVTAATGPPEALDKEWIACDNWASSPFRGRCYLAWAGAQMRTTTDGGLTWSASTTAGAGDAADLTGAQPLVRPDGTVVVVFAFLPGPAHASEGKQIVVMRSTDGGVTLSPPVQAATLDSVDIPELRSPPLPSAGIDGSGRLYAVWEDCRFSPGCDTNDLVLSTSDDGITWSEPSRIPTTAVGTTDSLIPGLGVDPQTAG